MLTRTEEFGSRLVKLNTGVDGIRGSLLCDVKSVAGDEPLLDFVASDGSLDRYEEVVSVTGWELANYRKNPVVVDSHDYSSVSKILGRSEEVKITDGKLVNRVRFCLDNPMGVIAFKMAKGGFIKSESVGFIPIEWNYGKPPDPYRTYTKQELLEISLVAVPANPAATIGLTMKSYDDALTQGTITKNDLRAAIDYWKTLCGNPVVPATHASTPGSGDHSVQLLHLARIGEELLKRT